MKPAPWPALLSDLGALRDRYIAAVKGTEGRDRGGDVADAVASTLEVLSDIARAGTARLEASAPLLLAEHATSTHDG
jgi:hypothetical protein